MQKLRLENENRYNNNIRNYISIQIQRLVIIFKTKYEGTMIIHIVENCRDSLMIIVADNIGFNISLWDMNVWNFKFGLRDLK